MHSTSRGTARVDEHSRNSRQTTLSADERIIAADFSAYSAALHTSHIKLRNESFFEAERADTTELIY